MRKTIRILGIEKRLKENLEDFLEREYIFGRRGIKDIARQIMTPSSTLKDWTIKLGISLRTESENLSLFNPTKPSKEELVAKYQILSSNQIAVDYDVTGRTVRNWLKECGISLRVPMPCKEELLREYQNGGLNHLRIKYNVSSGTAKKWLKNYGIRKADFLEAKPKQDKKSKIFEMGKSKHKNNENKQRGKLILEDFFSDIKPLIDFYNPLFKDDASGTVVVLRNKINASKGYLKQVYSLLFDHYTELRNLTTEQNSLQESSTLPI